MDVKSCKVKVTSDTHKIILVYSEDREYRKMAVKRVLSEDGKILTIKVPSRLDITAHKEFGEVYKDKLGPVSSCVVDMAEVEFLDSSALGMLLMFRERATAENVDITIANCSPGIKKIFSMANFDKLFKIE